MECSDPNERLVVDALTAHKGQYKELAEIWRDLDSKAQGTIAVSGVFLAGALAFIRALTAAATTAEKLVLTATAGFLALSIVFALIVLWVRSVRAAPLGGSLDGLVQDLIAADDGTSPQRLLNYYRDQAGMWQVTNRDVEKVNTRKARFLLAGQITLVMAIICAAVVTLMRIWRLLAIVSYAFE